VYMRTAQPRRGSLSSATWVVTFTLSSNPMVLLVRCMSFDR
jgi:hypothetical protein